MTLLTINLHFLQFQKYNLCQFSNTLNKVLKDTQISRLQNNNFIYTTTLPRNRYFCSEIHYLLIPLVRALLSEALTKGKNNSNQWQLMLF